MLEARLAVIARIQPIADELARDEQARVAMALLRGRAHDLANHVQIVHLAALELERRGSPDGHELVRDLRTAAEHARAALEALVASAHPPVRTAAGPPAASIVRAAIAHAAAAVPAPIALAVELADTVATPCSAAELEAIACIAVLATTGATRVAVTLRERAIDGARWVELLCADDRHAPDDDVLDHAFAPYAGRGPHLHVARALVERIGGEASLSRARDGLELVFALPAAPE